MKFIIFLIVFGLYHSSCGLETIPSNSPYPDGVPPNLNSLTRNCNSSTVLCNGIKDCQNGSDEQPKLCKKSKSRSRWCKMPPQEDETKYIVKCDKYIFESLTDYVPEMCSLVLNCNFQNDENVKNPTGYLCSNKTWIPTIPSCSKTWQALNNGPNTKTKCFYFDKEILCPNVLQFTDQTKHIMFNQSVILTSKCYCNDKKIPCNELSNCTVPNNHSTPELISKCYCNDSEIPCNDFSECRKCYCNDHEIQCEDLSQCKPAQIYEKLIPQLVSKGRCNGKEIPCSEFSNNGIQPNERLTPDQSSNGVNEGIKYLVQSDMDLIYPITCFCDDEEIPCSDFISCKMPTKEQLIPN